MNKLNIIIETYRMKQAYSVNRIAMVIAIATLLASGSATAIAQEAGTITGRVVDATTGEPLIGSTIMVVGTKLGAKSNVSGSYSIKRLPPGVYDLQISSIGYGGKTIQGIAVEAGRTATQDFSLTPKSVEGRTVTVTGTASRQSENAALIERKRSSQVSDAISADQIGRAPASDASDAIKRVTGVSVVGGKYVIMRGLSERYSATQLNGINLPSPEPEKKVVPFDMFPSSMISRITTIKTFTPDNPGDFAGGLVKITTKDDPEQLLVSFSASAGMNSQVQGVDALAYPGGSTDFLGIDDGTRALPENLPPGRRSTSEQQAQLLERFNSRTFTPTSGLLPMNRSFSLSLGNQFDIGVPLGFLVSGSYAASSNLRNADLAYPLLSLTDGEHDLRYQYSTVQSERTVLWGGLATFSAQLAPEHKVSLKTVYNRSSEDEARTVEGFYNQSTTGNLRSTRLQFVERSLLSSQLDGEHQLEGFLNSKVDWRLSYSTASRYEPDNRSTTYFRDDDGTYRFANNFGSGNGRFFSGLDDAESNAGVDWSVPFESWNGQMARLKVGGLGRFRSRDFSARRFLFGTADNNPQISALSPDQLFTADNVRSGTVTFNDDTQRNDAYTASEQIGAGYAMVDIPLVGPLRLIGGVRFEQWNLDLYPVDVTTGERMLALSARRNVGDLLPSVNLVYALGDEMNVRVAATQTLARPEFRELSAFRFDDYRQSTYGNPSLERTKITNYDLRWEWFPGSGEVISVGGFYKQFADPIEQFYLIGGSDIALESANAKKAWNYGVEFELRKGLGIIGPALENFWIGTNVTLVESKVSFASGELVKVFDGVTVSEFSSLSLTSPERPLQGQSPYVVNASVGYDNFETGTAATILYNAFGSRLAIVGTSGIPDTYEQPRGSFDVSLTQRLPYGLLLKLSGKNLLDDEVLLQQRFASGETIAVERYRSGRTISLGVAFNFDQLQFQNSTPVVAVE